MFPDTSPAARFPLTMALLSPNEVTSVTAACDEEIISFRLQRGDAPGARRFAFAAGHEYPLPSRAQ